MEEGKGNLVGDPEILDHLKSNQERHSYMHCFKDGFQPTIYASWEIKLPPSHKRERLQRHGTTKFNFLSMSTDRT